MSADRLPLARSGQWVHHLSLRGADRNLVLTPGRRAVQHNKSWRQAGHPTNGNKKNYHITESHFDNWKPSNIASVRYHLVLYGLHSRDVKR